MLRNVGSAAGGGAMAGGSSSGFGDWFAQVQQEELQADEPDLESGLNGLWGMLGGGAGASEKKHDGGDSAESQGFLSGLSNSLQRMSPGGVQSSQSQSDTVIMGMGYQTRLKGFVATVVLAHVFFLLAFTIGLPVVLLRPHKFALLFTMGSISFMMSFSFLKGPVAHLKSMCQPEYLRFTSAYLASMLATLWAALVVRSYVLVVATSGAQFLALGYYMVSAIPGGPRGLEIAVRVFVRGMRLCIGACVKTIRMIAGPCCGLQC